MRGAFITTHFALEHRAMIEESLKEKMSFSDIADLLYYDRTSISHEIKNKKTLVTKIYITKFWILLV